MVLSRLPHPSLLVLFFGGVLTLNPKEPLDGLKPLLLNHPELQIPLAVAVEQYNLEASDRANYYKALHLMALRYEGVRGVSYFLEVTFVKTTCKKKARKLHYKRIQECERIPGNHKELFCYFSFSKRVPTQFHMKLDSLGCE